MGGKMAQGRVNFPAIQNNSNRHRKAKPFLLRIAHTVTGSKIINAVRNNTGLASRNSGKATPDCLSSSQILRRSLGGMSVTSKLEAETSSGDRLRICPSCQHNS